MSTRVSAGVLHGIIAAVPTPLDERGDVDEPALRRIVNRLVSAGMSGLWVLGSGSEFACLHPNQQERVLLTVTSQAGGRIPVIAGTGACSTAIACDTARRAESAGADAIFVIPPYYFSCSPSELTDHFLAAADASSLPVVLYNNPWNTRTPIPLDLIASLATDARFIGIKDSSADWDNLQRILNAVPRDGSFAVLQGNELALGPGILLGADGAVIALPVIAPELCLRVYRAARQGNVALVRELQSQVADLFQIYVDAGRSADSAFLSSQKAALELLGLCSRRVSRPFRDANDAEMKRVELLLQKHGLLFAGVTDQGRL